jgi:hypothetical protein
MLMATPSRTGLFRTWRVIVSQGSKSTKARWRTVVESCGRRIGPCTAELAFVDPIRHRPFPAPVPAWNSATSALRGRTRAVSRSVADEERGESCQPRRADHVDRSALPPKFFSPDRSSSARPCLVAPDLMPKGERMGFAKPEIATAARSKIAMAFYQEVGEAPDVAVPPIIADSSPMTGPICWRPPMRAPSPTMRQSPFASILREEPDEARAASSRRSPRNDHAWAADAAARLPSSPKGTEVPGGRHLFRGARRKREGPGCRRAGDPQPRAQSRLSRHDLRRRLPEPDLAQPLPVLLCLRRHPRSCSVRPITGRWPKEVAMAVTAGKIWHAGGRLFDPLPRDLRQSALGTHDEARARRSACTSSTAPMAVAGAEARCCARCRSGRRFPQSCETAWVSQPAISY